MPVCKYSRGCAKPHDPQLRQRRVLQWIAAASDNLPRGLRALPGDGIEVRREMIQTRTQ